jgi:uncharacterized membrane protein/predicted DsbA family dithiol-disulfide isomerase
MTARVFGFRVIALAGLAFTSFLLTDDVSQVPSFCPFHSGCADVTTSAFGRPLGIPLSAVGLVAFVTFFVLTLFPRTKADEFLGPMALAAGIGGLLLVGVQFLILKRTCRFCLIVDSAGILLAAAELGLPHGAKTAPIAIPGRLAWAVVALGVAVAAPVWSVLSPPPPVPSQVKQAWLAGKINIVEITDFTCPYCRRTHEALENLRHNNLEGIHFVRFVAPAPNNEIACAATRAYECAIRQAGGEKMANVLFTTDNYSADNLRELARKVGLDLVRFDADWKDPVIDLEIASTRQWVHEQRLAGLPQVWVQGILLLGEQTPENLTAVARRVRSLGGRE